MADADGRHGRLAPARSHLLAGARAATGSSSRTSTNVMMLGSPPQARRGAPRCRPSAALHALHQLLKILEAEGSAAVRWGELVATLTLTLGAAAAEAGAQRDPRRTLQEEQLARGLQQLVLMLLPCLDSHSRQVVRILESFIPRNDEPPAEPREGPRRAHLLALPPVPRPRAPRARQAHPAALAPTDP